MYLSTYFEVIFYINALLLMAYNVSTYINYLLSGTVLNVECAMMKTFEFLEDFKVDPDSTCYTSEAKMKRLTQILRIFYILGPPTGEEICKFKIFDMLRVFKHYERLICDVMSHS